MSSFLKTCVHSKGPNFASILIKLHQNVCLDDIFVKFKCGLTGQLTFVIDLITTKQIAELH